MNFSISKRQQNTAFYQRTTQKKFTGTNQDESKYNSKIDFEFTGNSSPKIWGYRF